MRTKRSNRLTPALLILLSIVPAIAGVARLLDLAPGHAISPANARFHALPLPIVLHVLTALPFSILGALQFAPALRRGSWHRISGRLLAPVGLLVAISGLWMTLAYPWPPTDGRFVYVERLLFGTAMLVSILLGLRAVRRRDFTAHADWMTRGYAIGLGAGTQVLTHIPWFLVMDIQPGGYSRAVMMGAGWVINLLVAERAIRARASGSARKADTHLTRSAPNDNLSLQRVRRSEYSGAVT